MTPANGVRDSANAYENAPQRLLATGALSSFS